jgi:hypothetical protein
MNSAPNARRIFNRPALVLDVLSVRAEDDAATIELGHCQKFGSGTFCNFRWGERPREPARQ